MSTVIDAQQIEARQIQTRTFNCPKIKGAKGFTLLEILVSLSISATLIAGIIHMLGGSKRTDYFNDQLATMQENARVALALLADDIRMAGHLGCADPNNGGLNVSQTVSQNAQGQQVIAQQVADPNRLMVSNQNVSPLIYGRSSVVPVMITGADDTQAVGSNPLANTPRSGTDLNEMAHSDVLIVQRAEPNGVPLDNISNGRNQFTLRRTYDSLEADDLAIITDCQRLDLFYASSFNPNTNTYTLSAQDNTPNRLHSTFNVTNDGLPILQAKVHRFRGDIYYVSDANADNIPALYRTDLHNPSSPKQEIVRGIENLQVLYGVEASPGIGSADISYVNATELNTLDNPRVIAVRIALLTRSYKPMLTANKKEEFNLLGSVWEHNDKYLRSVFTSTIRVRNNRPDV